VLGAVRPQLGDHLSNMCGLAIKVKKMLISTSSSPPNPEPSERRKRSPSQPPKQTAVASKPTTKRKIKQKRKRRMTAAEERWRQEFQTLILQDSDLYHRILRYEVCIRSSLSSLLKLTYGSANPF
jgi:hypothetical protein